MTGLQRMGSRRARSSHHDRGTCGDLDTRAANKGASCRHHSAVSTSNPAPSTRRNPEFLIELGCTTTGYLHNEEANVQSFTADGWFRTGDLG